MNLKAIIFLTYLGCVLCEDTALLSPCPHKDSECIGRNTEKFLNRTSGGIVEYNIKPIDPIEIEHVEYADPGSDIVFHFKNIKITGMKKLSINNFTMNLDSKSVVLQAKADFNIESDLTVELKQVAKFISGPYSAKASNVYLTAYYKYDLIPNDKGVVFYDVGPETITCEATDVPKVTLGSQFANTITNDPDATARRSDYEKRAPEIRKKALCKILSQNYAAAIHNIRATAKVLPKSDIFSDV